MSLLVPLLVLLFASSIVQAETDSNSTESNTLRADFLYRQTLADDVQKKLSHCDSLDQGPPRLLCELLGALDSQGLLNDDQDPGTNYSKSEASLSQRKCRFESEGGHQFHRYATPGSPQLQKVIDRYLAMHRRCTALEFDNITNIFNSGGVPRCRYFVWGSLYNGLGNRLIFAVSAFIYAILSQRVLLIDYPVWDLLFCDPFQGLSPSRIPADRHLDYSLGIHFDRFKEAECGFGNNKGPDCEKTIVHMDLTHISPLSETEFMVCPSGISRVRNVPFMMMRLSNQYFAPGFFLNPALAPVLDVLFPERNPFHVLSKYLFSPSDQVWKHVRHYLDGTLAPATRRIGVQIREFIKETYTDAFDPNILRCIQKKAGFTPLGLRKNKKKLRADEYFSVYVATLAQGHIAKLNQTLPLVRNETGKNFKVAWKLVDGREAFDSEHQQEALIDMWVLSLSDVLLTSRKSTFGYVAQALGGLIPYLINPSEDEICETGIGTDPCYHRAPNGLVCNLDKVSAKELLNQSHTVKYCPDIMGTGWQLASPL